MRRWTSSRISIPAAASTQKIARQPDTERMAPPTIGARIGATPITSISDEKARADSCASSRSRITARAITMPAQPPRACRKRHSISDSTLRASAQPTAAAT
ncbi:hypothetical protein D9M72_358760 [compost metagenome]